MDADESTVVAAHKSCSAKCSTKGAKAADPPSTSRVEARPRVDRPVPILGTNPLGPKDAGGPGSTQYRGLSRGGKRASRWCLISSAPHPLVARPKRDAEALGVAYLGAFRVRGLGLARPHRRLKGAFHSFARRPGFLHCALHLGLRLARLLGLVSNFVILRSGNASSVLLSASRVFLAIVILPIRRLPPHPSRRPTEHPAGGTSGALARRLGIGGMAAESPSRDFVPELFWNSVRMAALSDGGGRGLSR
jgi:hypothetical protein